MEDKTMFETQEVNGAVQTRGLYHTAELTQRANAVAKGILKDILEDSSYHAAIKESQKSNDAMDNLIESQVSINQLSDFLNEADMNEIEKMLKSQQSKRSRLKGKAMTLENYTSLMTAGVAELMLRSAGNIEKGRTTFARAGVGYSDEALQELAADQEALAKAIRNVQSKKCIAKGKAGFDPTADEFQEILHVENQLKALRVGGTGTTVIKVKNMLPVEEDLESMSSEDAKALLIKIASQITAE
jgi:hypothetical protein